MVELSGDKKRIIKQKLSELISLNIEGELKEEALILINMISDNDIVQIGSFTVSEIPGSAEYYRAYRTSLGPSAGAHIGSKISCMEYAKDRMREWKEMADNINKVNEFVENDIVIVKQVVKPIKNIKPIASKSFTKKSVPIKISI